MDRRLRPEVWTPLVARELRTLEVLTLVMSLVVFGLINIAPGLTTVKAGIVPSACGLSVGKLVVGLWKEAKT